MESRNRFADLRGSHRKMVRQLELARSMMREVPSPSSGKQRSLIDGFGLQLKRHFVEEERKLYKPLRSRLGKGNPMEEMMHEHESIRRAFERLVVSSVEYESGRCNMRKFQLGFDSLRDQLIKHMKKEENVVYWLADLKL